MIRHLPARLRASINITSLAVVLFLSWGILAWLAYRATQQWENASRIATQRRADAAVDLLVAALTRDMRGVQATVLASPKREQILSKRASGAEAVANAFARYPYPEVFFAFLPGAEITFYGRVDRLPPWLSHGEEERLTVPVVVRTAEMTAAALRQRLTRDIDIRKPFSIFDLTLGKSRYQVVTLLIYSEDLPSRPLRGSFGFLVDLDWVKQHYFSALADQVTRIVGSDDGILLSIFDGRDQPVFRRATASPSDRLNSRRRFPFAFFNPLFLSLEPSSDLTYELWTAEAIVSDEPTLGFANYWARLSLALTTGTALVLVTAVIFAVRTARTNAALAEMRSEFVAAVTHELKTPVAVLRTISETLVSGRSSPQVWRDYAQMALHETKRLNLLMENLLTYARITKLADVYSFELVDVAEVVEHTLREFDWRLQQGGFQMSIEIPEDIPPIRADRTALELALSNVVDNAIRYSPVRRNVSFNASQDGDTVVLTLRDSGVGIRAQDLPHVKRRFVRAHNGVAGGSGLGLAITDRIILDHGGSLTLQSTEGVGTTVTFRLPAVSSSRSSDMNDRSTQD